MAWLTYSHRGVAKRLVLDIEPTGAVAGVAFTTQPVGHLVDGSGLASRASGIVVTAVKLSGTGTLGGTLTAVTDDEGIFAFTDLEMDTATGSVALQFTVSGLVAVTSAAFPVTTSGYTLSADAASYAWTGAASTLRYGRRLVAGTAAYTWTVATAATRRTVVMPATTRLYSWTPAAATLTYGSTSTVLFQEGFESGTLSGWFDDTSVPIVADSRTGSTGTNAMAWSWALGATQPTGVGSCRRDFTPSESVYLSYWIKCSSNWVGSGVAFHPHMFHFLTTADDHYIGPSVTHLTTYDELLYTTGGMVSLMSLQDSLNIDTANLLVDLTAVTENRSIGGYNGQPESGMEWDTYDNGGGDYRNYKTLRSPSLVLTDANKNDWHHFESYWQMNTISGGIGQPDGVMQQWVDGVQIHNRSDVYFRTNANPTMQFRTFVMAPYMQVGAPVAQSMWIDDITVSTGRTQEGEGAQNPNEPSGYTLINQRSFDAVSETGWGSSGTTYAAIVTDATAPVSPSNVMRITYPAGYAAGDAPWHGGYTIGGSRTGLYYHYTLKHSANFQGQSSGTNKIGYIWVHGNPAVFFSAEGTGSGDLQAQFRLQNVPDSRGRLTPNLGTTGQRLFVRDVWNDLEVQIIANTPGVANGVARWWLNGVHIGEYTDVQYASGAQSNTWEEASIYPIWGGVGGTVTNEMYIYFDHFYMSGA